MTINISDVAVNIGQQVGNSEWLEFLKILLPVFLGGYITYKVSEKAKFNETKQDNIKKFVLLSQITNFCFNDIYVYKDQVLKPIRKKINDNSFENNLTSLYIPLNEFNIDIEKYIFLGDKNFYFPDLLNKTNTIYQLYKQTIDSYNEFVKNDINARIVFKNEYVFNEKSYKQAFENLEKITNELLVRLYYILKNCNACYAKFYNLSCIDNLEESFKNLKLEETNILKEILEDEKYNHIKQYQEIFEKNWAGQPKFICVVCFIVRKFKHHMKWLRDFFALPKNCKFICWKNNKGK